MIMRNINQMKISKENFHKKRQIAMFRIQKFNFPKIHNIKKYQQNKLLKTNSLNLMNKILSKKINK